MAQKAAHTFIWVTDKEATETEAGMKHEECVACGYQKAAVEIPMTGTEKPAEPNEDEGSPQTGDNSHILLWLSIMLTSGVALIGTVAYSRKRRKYSR